MRARKRGIETLRGFDGETEAIVIIGVAQHEHAFPAGVSRVCKRAQYQFGGYAVISVFREHGDGRKSQSLEWSAHARQGNKADRSTIFLGDKHDFRIAAGAQLIDKMRLLGSGKALPKNGANGCLVDWFFRAYVRVGQRLLPPTPGRAFSGGA